MSYITATAVFINVIRDMPAPVTSSVDHTRDLVYRARSCFI